MKLTNRDILEAVDALTVFARQPLPVGPLFACGYNTKLLRDPNETYLETRNTLLQKYAKKDEAGKVVTSEDGKNIELEDPEAFNKDSMELLKTEIELDIKTVSLAKFPPEFTMQLAVMQPLMFMFTE